MIQPPPGWAMTKLREHEAACRVCGRAVWDGVDRKHAIGFLTSCGRRVTRLEDCGTVNCEEACEAAAYNLESKS